MRPSSDTLNHPVRLVECPRDAMQGWDHFIPTAEKIRYLQALLKVGFHTLDAGSFVSSRAIPQLADTADVFEALDLSQTNTQLLAIIANLRGAEAAGRFSKLRYLGFPFSVSETFQHRNTNSSIAESFVRLKDILSCATSNGQELVVYLSMGFGNPYGDPYTPEIVLHWARHIHDLGVKIISAADTVGLASARQVRDLETLLIDQLPGAEIGMHLHSHPGNWQAKLEAALEAGCTRLDGAINGIGGCPMAGNSLVGNMDTVRMKDFLERSGYATGLHDDAFRKGIEVAAGIFV